MVVPGLDRDRRRGGRGEVAVNGGMGGIVGRGVKGDDEVIQIHGVWGGIHIHLMLFVVLIVALVLGVI